MSSSSSSSSHHSTWLYSYAKLRFFNRIRRFLLSKSSRKGNNSIEVIARDEVESMEIERKSVWSNDEDSPEALQKAVKNLHFGSLEEKEMAAGVIERMAKECKKVRKSMVELGVIPALIAMVASELAGGRVAAAKALIELAKGSSTNKALMLESGILSKLPKNIEVLEESTSHELSNLMLSLSTSTKTYSLEKAIPFLVGILDSSSSIETKSCCIETLYNCSKVLDTEPLIINGVIPSLLKLCSVKEVSEKTLATLGNIVVSLKGRKEMENSPILPKCLIDILRWEDKPNCQEISAYILMVLAHQSSSQREKMGKFGIIGLLLELALMGSPIAQKRALKLLELFKDEKRAKVGPHSGPQTRRVSIGSPVNRRVGEEGKIMMKNLVKLSLYQNMEMITRRANEGSSTSRLKSFVISTSSSSSSSSSSPCMLSYSFNSSMIMGKRRFHTTCRKRKLWEEVCFLEKKNRNLNIVC